MADEPKETQLLEAAENAQEDAELKAQIEKLKAQQGPAEAPADVQDDPVPQEKPAEVVAAEPEKPKEEVIDHKAWARIRALEKELKEVRQAKPPVEQETLAKPQGPTYEDDPAEYLKQRTAQLETELMQQRQESQRQAQQAAIRDQEAAYEREHPDYKQAIKHLEENELNEWELARSARETRQMRALVDEGKRNPQFRHITNHVNMVAARDDIRAEAEKNGRDPEDYAAYLVARDTYIQNQRYGLWAEAEARGKTVPELAYEVARHRGWKAPEPTEQKPKLEESREKVLQQQQISEATNSLSETNAGAPAERRVLRSRAEVINLADGDLDALIESGQYRQL